MVFFRFGSLTDFSSPRRTIAWVARRLLIPRPTVQWTLTKFGRRGYSVDNFGHRRQKFACIAPHLRKALVDPRTLHAWAPYNLLERSELIRRTFGESVPPTTLRKFYLASGVRYTSSKKVYEQAMTNRQSLDRDRRAFARLLSLIIVRDKPLVYLDETSFVSQIVLPKSWALASVPNQHSMTKTRYSITVYGAVGACMAQPVYYLAPTTNAEHFRKFLALVKQSVPRSANAYLLYDGHAAHRTCLADIQSHFTPLPNPGYSSNFNVIESIWGVSKRLYQKKALARGARFTFEHFKVLVLQSLHHYDAQIPNFLRVNRNYVLKYLAESAPEAGEAAAAATGSQARV